MMSMHQCNNTIYSLIQFLVVGCLDAFIYSLDVDLCIKVGQTLKGACF
jgi:hypothetical protein